jgi:hypothetical protein
LTGLHRGWTAAPGRRSVSICRCWANPQGPAIDSRLGVYYIVRTHRSFLQCSTSSAAARNHALTTQVGWDPTAGWMRFSTSYLGLLCLASFAQLAARSRCRANPIQGGSGLQNPIFVYPQSGVYHFPIPAPLFTIPASLDDVQQATTPSLRGVGIVRRPIRPRRRERMLIDHLRRPILFPSRGCAAWQNRPFIAPWGFL